MPISGGGANLLACTSLSIRSCSARARGVVRCPATRAVEQVVALAQAAIRAVGQLMTENCPAWLTHPARNLAATDMYSNSWLRE